MAFVLVFLAALASALIAVPLATRLGRRLGLVDRPGGRRQHSGAIPRTGGVAMYVAFVLAVGISALVRGWLPSPEGPDPHETTRLAALLLGSTFIFVFGFLDDRLDLRPRAQYVGQIVAALIAIAGLVFIERVMNPFTNQITVFPWPFVIALTLFWIVGMINTVNFLDGLDGLAAGVAAILSAVLAVHMIRQGQYSVALLPLALLGATLGFLPFNFHPARIFMGSSGSFFLGFAVASLGIVAGARVATVLLVFSIPILDVAWQVLRRLRAGQSIGQGDRGHLHFQLQDLGFSQRQIVLGYYAFCAAFGALALLVSSRLYKAIVLLLLGAVMMAMLAFLSRRKGENRTLHPPDADAPER
ncbi:MAG: glycosyltransferase family 4 protein [Chloroflexota bacterium]